MKSNVVLGSDSDYELVDGYSLGRSRDLRVIDWGIQYIRCDFEEVL